MIVTVKCLKNNQILTYFDVEKIEQGMFWDDDLDTNIIWHRLYLPENETATFRSGFEIVMYCNEWEFVHGYERLHITV